MDTEPSQSEKNPIPYGVELIIPRSRIQRVGSYAASGQFLNELVNDFRKHGQLFPILLFNQKNFYTTLPRFILLDYEEADLVVMCGNNKIECIDYLKIPEVKIKIFNKKKELSLEMERQAMYWRKKRGINP